MLMSLDALEDLLREGPPMAIARASDDILAYLKELRVARETARRQAFQLEAIERSVRTLLDAARRGDGSL